MSAPTTFALSRRAALRLFAAAALTAPSGLGFASGGGGTAGRRFLLLELAGAVDGLALSVPHADPDYARLRGLLAIPGPWRFDGVFDLDGEFGLPRWLGALLPPWEAQEVTLIPAVGTGIDRPDPALAASVFASGGTATRDAAGWMGRLSRASGGGAGATAYSIGLPLPPVLSGGGSQRSPAGTPSSVLGFARKIELLAQDDPILGTAFAQAATSRADRLMQPGDPAYPRGITALRYGELAARELARPDGPRLAALRIGGWDSARDQGTTDGFLAQRLALVAGMIAVIRRELGPAWSDTVILVAAWTGRGVRPNATRGTDVGLGQTVLLAGGNVAGGQLAGAWPGLGADGLTPEGFIRPTTGLNAVIKAVLRDHLGLAPGIVDQALPDARETPAMAGLFRN